MKKVGSLSLIILLLFLPVSGQSATIWGPGDNYEIDFLHSGLYRVNDTNRLEFNNEASTEFTLHNVTNAGYDYNYIGYQNLQEIGSVTMQSFSFGGFGSITIPTGGMPVILPLSYGEEDDYMTDLSERITAVGSLNPAGDMFSLNSSTDDTYLYLQFSGETSESVSLEESTEDAFFNLPQLQLPEYEGKNNTLINATVAGDLRYQMSTGALFSLNITIQADHLLVDSQPQGPLYNNQELEFVAIIPPASIIDEFGLNILLFILIASFVILRKPLRKIFRL